jgi:HEAT repeat protein
MALRQALGSTSGLIKVGLIGSLGRRQEPESVALLAPLLFDRDNAIAAAAASALGRIGGKDSMSALSTAREKVPAGVQPAVLEGLLQCAERLHLDGDSPGAAAVYQELFNDEVPVAIRLAAWRGLTLSDARQRSNLMTEALSGKNRPTQIAALKLIRETCDAEVVRACAQQWASLPADSQVAVLDAHLKLGTEALPTVRAASKSRHPAVRVAAWQALADLNDPSSIPALAKAAACGESGERLAARHTLSRVHGPGAREALLTHLNGAVPPEKAELLRVLGERGDTGAKEVLLQNATAKADPVRLAALESLSQLALADTLEPLLGLAAESQSDAERQPVLKALSSVCQANRDKEQTSLRVIEAMDRSPIEERRQMLPLLAKLGTSQALEAARAATRNEDPELVKETIRVLAQWPSAAPAPLLLELARAGTDPRMRVLALRSCIRVTGLEPNASQRLTLLQQAMALATRAEEKKQVLGQIGRMTLPEALPVALKGLEDPLLTDEAGLAAVSIAERLAASNPMLADEVAVKILARCESADIIKRASALRIEPKAATLPPRDAYRTLRLSDQFYAEGAYYGDFNRDGEVDVVAGPFWFAGPDFQQRHEYRPANPFDQKSYSDNFLTFAGDFNGDGWTDVLCVGFPVKEGYWYENTAGGDGHWKQHLVSSSVGGESPGWADVTGDGRPELIFCRDGYLGYARPNPSQPDQPWVFHAISTNEKRFEGFLHGLGFGDINGDQRIDVVEAIGWWEQPANVKPGQPWTFHPFRFAEAGAQMLVNDVDGDELADIITAWHCHLYGLVWWKQIPSTGDQPDWQRQVILSPTPDVSTTDFRVSQMHALELVDMNGDGLEDILTGKRFWAHGPTGDKEPNAPAVVFWLELLRDEKGQATFVPHLIDDDSGVGTQVATTDLNKDGRPDVVVANKKGIFLHLSQAAAPGQ